MHDTIQEKKKDHFKVKSMDTLVQHFKKKIQKLVFIQYNNKSIVPKFWSWPLVEDTPTCVCNGFIHNKMTKFYASCQPTTMPLLFWA